MNSIGHYRLIRQCPSAELYDRAVAQAAPLAALPASLAAEDLLLVRVPLDDAEAHAAAPATLSKLLTYVPADSLLALQMAVPPDDHPAIFALVAGKEMAALAAAVPAAEVTATSAAALEAWIHLKCFTARHARWCSTAHARTAQS